MIGVPASYPFDGYYLYKVFHRGEQRYYANLVPIDRHGGLKRRTISYARYLMSVHIGRELSASEHVDHIDNNKMNDAIENLQIVSLHENNRKASALLTKRMVDFKCPYCGKEFTKPAACSISKKNKHYYSCSRVCSGKFSSMLSKDKTDPLVVKALEENIIRVYDVPRASDYGSPR
jgi:predicted RNA-binding Zn-ribbon protein involved in translation (DUF1610 family)